MAAKPGDVDGESYIVILKSDSPATTTSDGSGETKQLIAGASPTAATSKGFTYGKRGTVTDICDCLKDEFKVDVKSSYHHALRGFSTQMNNDQATRLAQHPEVQSVHKDVRVSLFKPVAAAAADVGLPVAPVSGKPKVMTVLDAATGSKVPWGVANARPMLKNLAAGSAPQIKDIEVDVDVYILDTGVDPTHPNLNVVESVSMISDPVASAKPLHGHGTHVAGTIAGSAALLGVAPRARIHSVRVLDTDGSGMMSWILAGIDLVTKRRRGVTRGAGSPLTPDVDPSSSSSTSPLSNTVGGGARGGATSPPVLVNMSLGLENGSKSFTLIDQAIESASDAGVIFCVAAGNSGIDAAYCSPAHSPRVITVGAYDSDNRHCYFSNWGSAVDILAPGDGILSTWIGGTFTELSGTSMATPHITGIVALYLSRNPEATDKDVAQLIISLRNKTISQVPRNTITKAIILPDGFRFAGKFSSKGSIDSATTSTVKYFTTIVS